MLTQILIAPLFIAASAVAHPAVHRRGDVPLSEWSSQNLESYWRYKVRYNSLGCASQTGTDFYNNCCSPLGASESLSDRPAECTPASLTCSVSASSLSTTPSPVPASPSPAPATPSSDDYDESSLPWCEEGQDEYEEGPYEQESVDESYNGGSTSNNPTPTDNSSSQPTDNGNTSDNSGNTGDNSGDNNSGDTGGNTNNGGSTGGDVIGGGHATWYYQNGNAGACGEYRGDYDLIGAIDSSWYGDLGQKSQYCGRSVRVTNTNNGRTVDIIVADVCPTCDGDNSFDLSLGAFQQLDDLGAGYIPITWSFI